MMSCDDDAVLLLSVCLGTSRLVKQKAVSMISNKSHEQTIFLLLSFSGIGFEHFFISNKRPTW